MISVKYILKIKTFALLLFVFSLPFENWNPIGITSFFSVTKMAGVLYAMTTLLIAKESFSFDRRVFLPFKVLLLFYLLYTIVSIFNYNGMNTYFPINFTLFQNLIMYWLIASDLVKNHIRLKTILLSLVLSIFLMSVLITLGIGIGSEYVEGVSRLTFFENNSNTLGIFAGLALTFSMYFILNPEKTYGIRVYYLFITLPLFVSILLMSGSRGALFSAVLAIIGMFVLRKDSVPKKIAQYSLLFIAGIVLINQIVQSQVIYKRLMEATEEGDLGSRGLIWRHAWEVYEKSPLIGFGNTGFEREMTLVHGHFKDTHNLFLYVMVTTGIIGLVIFLYFLYFHLKSAIRFYKSEGDIIKLAILLFYLTTVFKAGGIINDKTMWLLLSLIIVASTIERRRHIIKID